MKEDVENRIWGCLWGQAVGNALGLITEFMSKSEVTDLFPAGLTYKHTYYRDISTWEDDDTKQMLCEMDELMAEGRITPPGLAKRLLHWFETDGRGCGRLVWLVLHHPDFINEPFKAAEEIWINSGREAAPNGALMRTACIGLVNSNVEENAAAAAAVTHADPRCIGSCVVVSEIINKLIWEGRELSDKELIAIANRYDERIAPWIERGSSAGIIDELELDEPSSIGYTLRTLSAVIWALRHASDFTEGLFAIVKQGGDTDTNAAIACAVLGAKFGLKGPKSLPLEALDNLAKRNEFQDRVCPFVARVLDCDVKDLKYSI